MESRKLSQATIRRGARFLAEYDEIQGDILELMAKRLSKRLEKGEVVSTIDELFLYAAVGMQLTCNIMGLHSKTKADGINMLMDINAFSDVCVGMLKNMTPNDEESSAMAAKTVDDILKGNEPKGEGRLHELNKVFCDAITMLESRKASKN